MIDTEKSANGSARASRNFNASPEWYTPPWIIERVSALLGADYFDPCPAREGAPISVNGLDITWRGRVFCNPPYGRGIAPWVRKAVTEPVDELVLLVPASTDTSWFQPLFSHTLCFIAGRLYFHKPGGKDRPGETRTPHASVLVYRGERIEQFADTFADAGTIMCAYRLRDRGGLWEVTA